MVATCHPLYFSLAWLYTILVYYGEVVLLCVTLVFGSAFLLRYHVGLAIQLLLVVLFQRLFGPYFKFECNFNFDVTATGQPVGFTMFTQLYGGNQYINYNPFPAIEIWLLFYTIGFLWLAYTTEEWRLYTFNRHVYYRFIFLVLILTGTLTLAFIWFYSVFSIMVSAVLGILCGILWFRSTRAYASQSTNLFTMMSTADHGGGSGGEVINQPSATSPLESSNMINHQTTIDLHPDEPTQVDYRTSKHQ